MMDSLPEIKRSPVPAIGCALLLSLLLLQSAHAQQTGGTVSLGTVSGAPGNTVIVPFEFDNSEKADVLEARARIQGINSFSEVDVSSLCDSSSAFVVSCQLNDTNRIVVVAANQSGDPIESFTGSISFTIDEAAAGNTNVVLEWNAPQDQGRTFTPSQAVDGLVWIVTDGPQISVVPKALAFEATEVGQTSAPQLLQVSNSGSADGLAVGDLSISAEFAIAANGCDQAVLAQGDSCSIEVEFSPTTDGPRDGAMAISTNVGTRTVGLTGTGTGARLAIAPQPGIVDFGVVATGTNETIPGRFENTGSAPLDVECSLTTDTGDFQTQPGSLSWTDIPPGTSVDFVLVFAPSDAIEQSGSITCQSNALDQPSFQFLLTTPGALIYSSRFES